jgi:acyl-CoA oxidase
MSSAIKAFSFDNCLQFTQIARLCCGGHGYSASSGLSQLIQEADAGCTYEGDNIVLYLQTARYLLKCAQKSESPHLKLHNEKKLLNSEVGQKYKVLIDQYNQLYDQ